ncbi:AMP-binding protein [Pseudarcicella hirudinis]|uniref:AMP-binding protein n=1 Tax=Pseudarcicella hirudinis TaxID=1079859 RepID=UPI0035E5E66E
MMNPKILWKPDAETRKTSNLTQFIDYLRSAFQLDFQDYQSLWAWSVNEQEQFWRILFDYFGLSYSGEIKHVLTGNMPQTKWFEGISLNYAENIFTRKNEAIPAIIFKSESEESKHISWDELFSQTASLAAFLRKSGVRKGDRVAGYLPNIPQATVALLATASIGAIWSGASPDFGTESVLERFQQIEPSVFIAIDGYQYNGKQFNKFHR